MAYKKLSPSELRARGLSAKSERYISPSGEVISKRQYQQQNLLARHGQKISLIQRARNYARGLWRYLTDAMARAAMGRKRQSKERKIKWLEPPSKPPPPLTKPGRKTIPYYIRARLARISGERGNMSDDGRRYVTDMVDIFGREAVMAIVSPEDEH